MTLEPTAAAASVIGTAFVLAMFVARGHEIGWELSTASVFTLYVRVASLAASVVVAIGLAELFRAALVAAPLPEGFTSVYPAPRTEQLVRGATLLLFGVAFWAVHFFLPRPHTSGSSLLYLSFLVVGAIAFGLATVVTLPAGIAPEIQRLFGIQAEYRADGTLGGGIAALVLWLGHLWRIRAHVGRPMFGASTLYVTQEAG